MSIGGRSYGSVIINYFSSKSDVYFLDNRCQLYDAVRELVAKSERCTGHKVADIRFNGAGEQKGEVKNVLKRIEGVSLEFWPAYAPQRNGWAEHLVQELLLRASVMFTTNVFRDKIWAEAMHHGNWLQNRLPYRSIGKQLQMRSWRPNKNFDFSNIPTFVQAEFYINYRPATALNKNISARAIHVCFVGMERDEHLCRTYNAVAGKVYIVRLADFRSFRSEKLPSFASIL